MVFEGVLNPVFSPLLSLQPWLAILIIAAILTLLSTIVYKFTTPQARLKELRKQLKEHQVKIKKLSRDNPKKAMDIQKKAMELNMEYMKHSFKPMLYTFIPIILIFGWLQSHVAYEPLHPGVPFEVSAKFKVSAGAATISALPEGVQFISNQTLDVRDKEVAWTMKANPGKYTLKIDYEGDSAERQIIVTDEPGVYEPVLYRPKNSQSITAFNVKNEPLHPLGDSFSLFGWHPGWISFYIILSLIFSFGFRKALNLA